jgi:hypothetical protein
MPLKKTLSAKSFEKPEEAKKNIKKEKKAVIMSLSD